MKFGMLGLAVFINQQEAVQSWKWHCCKGEGRGGFKQSQHQPKHVEGQSHMSHNTAGSLEYFWISYTPQKGQSWAVEGWTLKLPSLWASIRKTTMYKSKSATWFSRGQTMMGIREATGGHTQHV
uniref:Uncharacterized protein n=1 Tax=Eutreptiella gymnastica TaxID=73025 RepID=A0A7S1JG71_9EUGL|mmetsp:Transcript_91631/g.158892  ORF Transcript_91631/g.158892 Transcript_91631/m.158892 type:complete len:124 (+) Transcript_91631:617-988(+)